MYDLRKADWEEVASVISRHLFQLGLPQPLNEALYRNLGGSHRVFPDGTPTLFAGLTLLSFACTAEEEPCRAAPAAAAMEMLVAAGDVGDDLQDEEGGDWSNRRAVGEAVEVITFLLLGAHQEIASLQDRGFSPSRVLRALRRLDRVMARALAGQDSDIRMESSPNVSLAEALRTTQQKAGNMTQFAAELGAILGTDRMDLVALCGQFGWHMGVLAQLTNDIAAVWPGGPVKSDLRLGKRTVPIVFTLQENSSVDGHQEHQSRGTGIATLLSYEEEEAKRFIWASGGIHLTWCLAALEKAKALRLAEEMARRQTGAWHLMSLLA